ncbi:MAG: hypothetical protein AABX89_04605 [Candidatus Thermoplasmatota archaeon]
MNVRLPLLALAATALLLSGCFGYPVGTAKPGDTVTVRYNATDATGQMVKSGQVATFRLGSGTSGLGLDVERALLGLGVDGSATVTSPAQARSFSTVVKAPQEFERLAIVQTYNTTAFTQQVGPPKVGMTFPAFSYNATMIAVTPVEVTFRLESKDGEQISFAQYGLRMVYSTSGEERVRTLEPIVGTIFSLAYANQIALELPAGTFKVLGAEDGMLRFGYTPGSDRALVERDLTFSLTVLTVAVGEPIEAPAGQYGRRLSPQVLGDVAPFLVESAESSASAAAPTAASDGHAHTH